MSTRVNDIPVHVAIIMDGNGRWAQGQSRERLYGHSYGVDSVREVVKGALELGVEWLTIYAFSTENWGRPQEEVDGLMQLLAVTIGNEVKPLAKRGVRLKFIGDDSRLPNDVKEQMRATEEVEIERVKLTLVVALNYSSRWEIVEASKRVAERVQNGDIKVGDVDQKAFERELVTAGIPDPELMIRTSGEMRLSNFLLWQLSYSELIFTEVLWPDFNKEEFIKAIETYQGRIRRFGKL